MNLLLGRIDLALTSTPHIGGDAIGHLDGFNRFLENLNFTDIPFWDNSAFGGMPFFLYYMILPFLLIAVLTKGTWFGLFFLILIPATRNPFLRSFLIALSAFIVISLDVNAAFKLSVLFSYAFIPLIVKWAFDPIVKNSNIYALSTFVWIYVQGFDFHGGNAISSLIGEFAFGIAISVSFIAIGLVIREKSWWLVAIPVAIVLTSHIIVAVFLTVIIGTYLFSKSRNPIVGYTALLLAWSFILSENLLLLIPAVPFGILLFIKSPQETLYQLFTYLSALGMSLWWLFPFLSTRDSISNPGWPRLSISDFETIFLGIVICTIFGILIHLFNTKTYISKEMSWLAASFFIFTILFFITSDEIFYNGRIVPFIGYSSGFALAYLIHNYLDSLEKSRIKVYSSFFIAIFVIVTFQGYQQSQTFSSFFFKGFENVSAAEEWEELTQMIADIPDCGLLAYENFGPEDSPGRYGSPASMTYLTNYNDCIGVTVGLYTESSASSLFHYRLNHSLSANSSFFTIDQSIPTNQIQIGLLQANQLGVRYVLLHSEELKSQTTENMNLIDQTEVWNLYEIIDFNIVESVEIDKLRWQGSGQYEEWRLDQLDNFQTDLKWSVFGDKPKINSLPETSFEINIENERVTGTASEPFILKQSYHEFWNSDEALLYPAGPNQTLVIPTETDFTLLWEVPYQNVLRLLSGAILIITLFYAAFCSRIKGNRNETSRVNNYYEI